MNILLTGSNGFVGSALKAHLRKSNIQVTDYDLPDCDILDSIHFRLKLNRVDMVIHMAAIADLYETAKDLDKNFDVNVKGTHLISKICAEENIPMIYISTCCVYGNSGHEVENEDETIPRTIEPYACSKVAGEYIVHGMQGLKYLILRIGTVFGENMRESLFNYIAFDKIINDKEITIYGSGEQTRNYIYIEDLINGIHHAIEKFNSVSGHTVNLCGSEEISVIDTINAVEKITGKKAKINNSVFRYGEILRENIKIEKAKLLLDWEPQYSYFDAMKKIYGNDKRFQKCNA